MILSPSCKTENKGYFTNLRVDKTTLPAGWYAYDIRTSDTGKLMCLEKDTVTVNHGGTFLTQNPVIMNARGYRCLSGRGGYTFE